jgi:hypothetical protein
MINVIVIAVSAIIFVLFMAWWRWPAFCVWIEAPKYTMLRQERRFDDQAMGTDTRSELLADGGHPRV